MNQEVPRWSDTITIRKSSPVKDLKRPEIHNFFWETKAYGSQYINTKSDIYFPHIHPYKYLQEIFIFNLLISKEKQQRSCSKYRKYYIKIFEDP